MKKVAFYTLGCKVNQYETEAMLKLFKENGYTICDFNEISDIYVINTCTVTAMSDRKSRQIIRRAKKLNESATVIVTGCYAQTNAEEIIKIKDVDLIIGNDDRKNIVKIIEEKDLSSEKKYITDIMKIHKFSEMNIDSYEERTRAYVKIQEGCNQFCSYCIIPYARGPIRSRNEENILEETKKLVKNGYSEIIYTGIHVASYGVDRGSPELSKLLKKADKIDGLKRIRLSSIEPMTLNEEFVENIKDVKKLCHHFHLSLQSGCDETLKRMNRKYTTEEYKNIVAGLRKHFPDVAITTDIMTGFPGETDEEFEKTKEFVKEISFADAHIFQYSPRKNTPAAKRCDQINSQIKEQRSKELIKITQKTRDEFISSFVGKNMDVLFEQPTKDGYFEGKTSNYITVRIKTNENLQSQYHIVSIDDLKNGIAYGHLI